MKRPLIAICVFALLVSTDFTGAYTPVAHAAGAAVDAEALIGMPAAGLSAMFGSPTRTEPSEYGFTWHVYGQDSRNYLLAGVRDGAVVALYSNASTLRYGGAFARGSSKSAVRAALGTPLSYIRSGNTVAVLSDRDQRDTFAVGDNYITVFYDMIAGGGVTSLMILPQSDQARATVSKQALDAGLIAAYERISVDLVNAARALHGLKTLAVDGMSASLAVSRSQDMVNRDYFSHYTPENKSPADLARAMGLKFTSLGENIAYGNSNAMFAFESFMNSDGHRANILKSAYTKIGAGVAYGGSRYVIVTNIFSNNTAEPLVPPLSGIKVSAGQLSPAFSNDTASYEVEVPATVSKVKVTPVRNTKNNKYTLINGKKATYLYLYPKIGGSATATIVGVAKDGKKKETFTVTVRRAALVTDIDISQGALNFDPAKTSYTVSVPADTDAVGITPAAAETGVQSLMVSGSELSPPVGGAATSKITAVAAGGKTKLTYSVTVKREPIITGIAVSGGKLSPSFSATRSSYTVSLPASSTPVTLTPAKGRDCARLTINDEEVESITVNPEVGESIPVRIKGVTAAGTESCYTVNVTRAALVTKLYSGTKGIALSPAFSPTNPEYEIHLPANVSAVSIRVTKAKSGVKTLTINGKKTTSYTAKPPVGGSVTVTVAAVSKYGASATYTIKVTRDELVSDISVSEGALDFDPAKLSYTVSVPADTPSVSVTPTAAEKGVKSMTVSASTLSPPPGGSATSKITAVATGGKTKLTYSVTVKRDPIIAGIDVSGGKLSPAFSAAQSGYTVSLPASSTPVTLTPAKGRDCARLTINDEETESITVNPEVGESIPVRIKGVTAAGTESCYTVNVTRAALVTKLYSDTKGVSLSPAFNPANREYTINLPAKTSSVVIKATKAGSGVKSMTINGKSATSFTAKPAVGGSVTVKVDAVSSYGTSVSYTVTVTRSAPVTGIEASAGEMRPAFSPGVTSYEVLLPADTESVTVTPTLTESCLISNNKDNAHPWAVLSPAPGGSDAVTFTASAADRTNTVQYTVTARRTGLLEDILVSPAALSPEFSEYKTEYTVNVGADVGGVTLEPQVKNGCSYVIDGSEANTPAVLRPAPGETVTGKITVTAPDSEKMTYKVAVRRQPLLAGISLSAGALSPKFEPGRKEYAVNIPAGVETVTITPEASPGCGYIIDGGNPNEPAALPVPSGGAATARIEAFAGGTDDRETYTITVRRGADLAGIKATIDKNGKTEELELVPDEEEPRSFIVTAPVPGGAAAVTLEALPLSGCVSVSMKPGEDGKFVDGSILVLEKPADADRILVEIRCTPDNGMPSVTYWVTVVWAG